MCIVCVELIKQKLTIPEAERNLGEMSSTEKNAGKRSHYQKLYDAIVDGDFDTMEAHMEVAEEPDERPTRDFGRIGRVLRTTNWENRS